MDYVNSLHNLCATIGTGSITPVLQNKPVYGYTFKN
jgi:hypothetical protein